LPWRRTGNDIEQLFVDTALAQPVELCTEIREQFGNVAIGALHGGKTSAALERDPDPE
jgi:hypothetical protein